MRLMIAGALSALLLTACGYQGPLYLPDTNAAPKQSVAPAKPIVPETTAVDAADAAAATQS